MFTFITALFLSGRPFITTTRPPPKAEGTKLWSYWLVGGLSAFPSPCQMEGNWPGILTIHVLRVGGTCCVTPTCRSFSFPEGIGNKTYQITCLPDVYLALDVDTYNFSPGSLAKSTLCQEKISKVSSFRQKEGRIFPIRLHIK